MSIDIERLKFDAAYWDEVAPEGATHAIPKRGYSATGVAWFKRLGKCDWRVWSRYDSGSFLRWCDSAGTSDGPHFITRPKPQSSEWDGEWLPAVGERCLGKHKEFNSDFECVINGYRNGKVWFTDFMGISEREFVYPLAQVEFRPIRTQAEREREEVVFKAADLISAEFRTLGSAEAIAEHLYDAGMLRKERTQ